MPPRLILLPGLDGTGRLSAGFLHALAEFGIDSASVLAYPADQPLGYEALTAFARAARLLHGIAGSREIVLDGPHLLLQAQPRPGAEAVATFLRAL